MGNSRKPSAPIKGKVHEMKPLTPEERKEQATRAYLQKRESIATGVLFNLMHNPELFKAEISPEETANVAIEIADKMIEKLYFTKEE
jgi:hypothetical protein